MALLANIPQPGRSPFSEPEYYVANRVCRDKITGNIHGICLIYRNEETRRAHGKALAALADTEASVIAAGLAVSHYKPDEGVTPEQDPEYHKLRVEQHRQNTLYRIAQEEIADPKVQPAGQAEFVIPSKQAADMLTKDGGVDDAKVYAWLKARAEMPGAQDA